MKNFVVLLPLAASLCAGLAEPVNIQVMLDQEQFLPGEALNVNVRIENFSGRPIHFGREDDWLKFSVQSRDGLIVVKNGEAPVREAIDLENAQAAIKRVNITPYFNLKTPGQYSVVASATIGDFSKPLTSAPKSFDIVGAAPLWAKEIGVPPSPKSTNQAPEVRMYSLLQANHLAQLTLYFRLADPSGTVNKVYPLGRMLNIGLPDAQVDRLSNLHVLYQIGAHSSCYTKINPEGDLVIRQTYDFSSRPRLGFDADGNITIVGATRRVTSTDIPPSKMAEAPPAESSGTN